jgi:hypothetical protein
MEFVILALLYYCFVGTLVLGGILYETFIKDSDEVFIGLAGEPAWSKVIGVVLAWPLVLGYVLVKCLHLRRANFKLRQQVYRMVDVTERRASYIEVEKAAHFLRWRYWRPVVDLNGQPLRFKSHQEVGAYINRLVQELLDEEFKVVRTPSKRFTRV